MLILFVGNLPQNSVLIPIVLAAIGIYCIYLGIKGLLKAKKKTNTAST